MPSPVTRIPPPPLLDIALLSVPLLPEPEPSLIPVIKGDPPADTSQSHATNSHPVITPKTSAVRRLVDLLNQINAEMEDDVARVRVAIGEAEHDIKLLHSERVYKAGQARMGGSDGFIPKETGMHRRASDECPLLFQGRREE